MAASAANDAAVVLTLVASQVSLFDKLYEIEDFDKSQTVIITFTTTPGLMGIVRC